MKNRLDINVLGYWILNKYAVFFVKSLDDPLERYLQYVYKGYVKICKAGVFQNQLQRNKWMKGVIRLILPSLNRPAFLRWFVDC